MTGFGFHKICALAKLKPNSGAMRFRRVAAAHRRKVVRKRTISREFETRRGGRALTRFAAAGTVGAFLEDNMNTNETRRRFLHHFAGIGLGTTLVPGILWARMQDAGARKITLAMVTDALRMADVEMPEADRIAMVESANTALTRFEELHKVKIPNDVSPPFHFSAIVPGIEVNKTRLPFRISAAPAVKRPANLEDVAFWPVRHLAELIRTKQVSSVELTQMYLARLHRYNAKLNNTVTFLDDLGLEQAKRADAELSSGRYKGPLHGIPWGAKDIISVKGYKTTWGSDAYKDQILGYIKESFDEITSPVVKQNAQKLLDTLASIGVSKFIPLTMPVWPYDVSAHPVEEGAFFDELVRSGRVAQMTSKTRANNFKFSRITPAVEYLQSQRVRMMMMMKLQESTAGVDVYLVAGGAGGGGGARGAAPANQPPQPQGPAQRHSGFANYACYPALNIMNGLNEAGMPTNVTFFARPFGEMELIALGKAYQDAAGLHLKLRPTRMD